MPGRLQSRYGKTFVIAEAGVNHNGDVAMARRLVDAAVEAKADAVKFQTFSAERLVAPDAPKAAYQKASTAKSESQLDMLRKLELSKEAHVQLSDYSREKGIVFISTPFDEESADLLEQLEVPAFKTPSGEITNLPYLAHIARKGRPMIVSTGMATIGEVEEAVAVLQAEGCPEFTLLHCTSDYPAAPKNVNLRAMATMRQAFSVPVGYSDHTLGIEIAVAAVALGAMIIEKHFTLDTTLPGPDHRASVEPEELTAMVAAIRNVEAAMGSGIKKPTPPELSVAAVARKSLVAVRDLPSGTVLSWRDLVAKRPGTGLSPALLGQVVGLKLTAPLAKNEVLTWDALHHALA